MNTFPRLFEPFERGRIQLANRIVITPHGTSMVRDGAITEDDIAYYEARARSGPAMIIGGAIVVHPTSALRLRSLVEGYNPAVIDGLRRRSDAIHAHGVKVIGQLVHLGRERIGAESDYAPSAPSPLRSPRDLFPPHELDKEEIEILVQAFVESALNLERSGHDGVEIHAAHGYLVAQFLSPATNQRADGYGGTPQRRLRFLREILDGIRNRCRDDFVLGVRLSADEEIADGLGIRDTTEIAASLAALGCVDYLSITLGTRGYYVKDITQPEAAAARAAHIIRDACGLPIIVGQRITTPEVAERLLAEGDADLIGMTRAFIADSEWVSKAARGEANRIRQCIGVNQDCRAFAPHLHCAINVTAGRELLPTFRASAPAGVRRRIAIVGAGPAGLETARVAALRGHAVTVFEASDSVGGQFLYASSVPHRQGLRRFIDYLRGELRHLGVPLELGTCIERADQLRALFDVVVIATGAVARPLDETLATRNVITWFDVLDKGAPAPHGNGRVVVVDDGSAFWWTYGVAEALAEAGWRVLLATPSAAIASAIPAESVGPLLARLGRAGTEFRVLSVLSEVTDDAAHLMNATSGEEEVIACALVVVQTGRMPVAGLFETLRPTGMELHMIGDCVTPRRMSHAVFEGYRLACSL
jgi:2,4-dienoyl-CoA reductase (NADPH2)